MLAQLDFDFGKLHRRRGGLATGNSLQHVANLQGLSDPRRDEVCLPLLIGTLEVEVVVAQLDRLQDERAGRAGFPRWRRIEFRRAPFPASLDLDFRELRFRFACHEGTYRQPGSEDDDRAKHTTIAREKQSEPHNSKS